MISDSKIKRNYIGCCLSTHQLFRKNEKWFRTTFYIFIFVME